MRFFIVILKRTNQVGKEKFLVTITIILKEILKEDRKDRNRAEFGLEDRICTLIQLYHIKRQLKDIRIH